MGFWNRLFRGRRRTLTYEAVREVQQSFQALVEGNNRVLELIADAGEKLGGEYIFDIQYLRTLARELADAVRGVVLHLNVITRDRYPELVDKVMEIESALQGILESRAPEPRPTEFVIPLDEVEAVLADVVGEKMARLGELQRRLGLKVPPGFVVTAYACRYFLEEAGIDPTGGIPDAEWMSCDDAFLEEQSARLTEGVRNAPLPKDLLRVLKNNAARLSRAEEFHALAVRSSALGEDGELSFAGQYKTLLGVPPDGLPLAYREVVAGLFSPGVMRYRRHMGLHPARAFMAVGCISMVDARAGGVLYTLDPVNPLQDVMMVTATRGLGCGVVDGTAEVDRFEISRKPPLKVTGRTVILKTASRETAPGGGLREVPLPPEEWERPALENRELHALAAVGHRIEKFMKCAQDIEWAVDRAGEVILLQARPLRIDTARSAFHPDLRALQGKYPVLLHGRGEIACRGVGCGRVRVVTGPEDLPSIEEGTVLVARGSTPWLAYALEKAAAVITDVGTATGHLATIAREMHVPAIVDTGTATELLAGAGEVTVDAEENVVYAGRVEELLRLQLLQSSTYEDKAEFRMLRKMLKHIAPLHLRDPRSPDFSPRRCRTFHDIIRFAHEKAVEGLIEAGRLGSFRGRRWVRRLDVDLPLDLTLIDLGGGLDASGGGRYVPVDRIRCVPLTYVLDGMRTEGAWDTGPADMDLRGFLSSATRSVPLTGPLTPAPEQNLAIVSGEYLNLNLKLGYHFNILDCYMTERRNDNFIYFRFAGGVTEMTRRSRRVELLRRILERNDFLVECRGDLVVGRIKKISFENMAERMRMLGRLIGFTRQLDIYLKDDGLVERYAERFLAGKYGPLRE